MLRPQVVARIDPGRSDPLSAQKSRTQRGGEQFAHRHDPRANPIAEFPSLGDRIGHALQLIDESVESRIGNDA